MGIAVVVGLAQTIPNLYFAVVVKVELTLESHLNGVTKGKLLPLIPLLPVV